MTGRADPRALRAKYEVMLALRERHDAGDEADPEGELVALATRFPGALRELDALPLDAIRARIDELAAAERDSSRVAPWMAAQSVFHELARSALEAKRWLGGRHAVTPDMKEDLRRTGAAAAAWAEDLGAIARPPRGRILDLVYARTAATLGMTERDVRAFVYVRPSRTTRS